MTNHAAYCYCHTCGRSYHYLGIAGHRAAHRRRRELVKITMASGTWSWDYREDEP